MRARRQRAACARRSAASLAAWMLGACFAASCGDATGSPIRSLVTADAAAQDAGNTPDAMSSATLTPAPVLPAPGSAGSGSKDGPSAMHDRRLNNDVPHIVYCVNTANWPADLEDDEHQLEQAIDQLRDGRVRCADRVFDQLPRLSFPPELRCSARVHSFDMAAGHFFDTQGSDGSKPGERMTKAGFAHGASAESIVRGDSDLGQVLIDLLNDPEGCSNLTRREFTSLGIGEYAGLWTFDFAADP